MVDKKSKHYWSINKMFLNYKNTTDIRIFFSCNFIRWIKFDIINTVNNLDGRIDQFREG